MENRFVIILAAGKGTRMKSKLYKVLHKVAGKAMVDHVLTQVENTRPDEIVTIVGHGAEAVKATLGERSKYALQAEQLGTGHAVLQAKELLAGKKGTTLVVSGDTPLLTWETLSNLFEYHATRQSSATILTANAPDPFGYGRIIRDHIGIVERIVEQKDASAEEARVTEINTGTYVFDNELLFDALGKIDTNNAQGEYYLTDIIEILKNEGQTVAAFQMDNFDESLGVNDRIALSEANRIMRDRINKYHMVQGVTLVDPASTYIQYGVKIGSDTIIEPNVHIKGKTVIGSDVVIGANSEIVDSTIEDNVKIRSSVIEESIVRTGADVGPMAHLRPLAEIGENAHVGNFVEVKKATLGKGTKAGHLTYIGNAEIGNEVNIGAGVIFVNYDGKNKYESKVDDFAFIGSNANIVSPVHVGKNGLVTAGSTITEDVAEDALAFGRARQVNKEDRAKNYPHYKG
ncbi:bifunctional UDP-N-acetylglucosamine pyrophosphorylase / Glucosamine-1-phosphate N-acetyltransferase [Pilibacter termitis]|uniref:Bifunctional protein GlmU n=1 Tax=Pilibacter termitis TaxID=263852 RepID=A0A1T4LW03_9ENTE|nr:bifunctional UDP-N-acetylglucosamine diphosphorylase/glucosamine-1-phosphate N-acetyltransferase GlmU [Pilibacter termitis]SJZ58634.1 bifunctional UDP-N-acetylglucosamine pyrophosphorylase / Glucosamine-1-phosphate N-acetyltransferase [Pilibacter termitis]